MYQRSSRIPDWIKLMETLLTKIYGSIPEGVLVKLLYECDNCRKLPILNISEGLPIFFSRNPCMYFCECFWMNTWCNCRNPGIYSRWSQKDIRSRYNCSEGRNQNRIQILSEEWTQTTAFSAWVLRDTLAGILESFWVPETSEGITGDITEIIKGKNWKASWNFF